MDDRIQKQAFLLFGIIPYGARIALYGAGKIGKSFLEINKIIKWCEILYIFDEKVEFIEDFDIRCIMPQDACKIDDKIDICLITILNKLICKEVKNNLIKYGLNENKIIYDNSRLISLNSSTSLGPIGIADARIAFIPLGGLGDYVVADSFINAFCIKYGINHVTIYADKINRANEIFSSNSYIERIEEIEKLDESLYHLVIRIDWRPIIQKIDIDYITSICLQMASDMKVIMLQDDKENYSLFQFLDIHYKNAIYLKRAKLMGWNRYLQLGMNGTWDVFPINRNASIVDEKDYKELNIPNNYITYNFGADMELKIRGEGINRPQVKQWPKEYHQLLNQMIKKAFPDVTIVQIGSNECIKIDGADRYVFGEKLGVVRHILEKAICHIDCEGGLVHLATQLGTKCFVMFGPTPVWFYGYDNNENFSPQICGECQGCYEDWYIKCHMYDKPECMYSITPEQVFDKIKGYLEDELYV